MGGVIDGVLDQIRRLLANGTVGPGASDLRCLRHAPLGGPLCPVWKENFFKEGTTDCAHPWKAERAQVDSEAPMEYPWTKADASLVGAAFTFAEYRGLLHRQPGCAGSQIAPGCAASQTVHNKSERFPGFLGALIKAGRGGELLDDREASAAMPAASG